MTQRKSEEGSVSSPVFLFFLKEKMMCGCLCGGVEVRIWGLESMCMECVRGGMCEEGCVCVWGCV